MSHCNIQKFCVIGIAVRTANENGQAGTDIPALWEKFMSEGIFNDIPVKTDNSIYCIYTDYEKDFTKPYTTILGCKVENLDIIPHGMVGKTFETANYLQYLVSGDLLQGTVFETWTKIWASDLSRAYTADFEVYGEKSQNMKNGKVDIFIAVN